MSNDYKLCDICAAEGYPYNKELCKNCEHNPSKEGFNNMESKTIEFDVGLKRVKFNVVKLKDCKYFIEDVTYANPIEYTVNLMLYPEDSPNADCAIITVHHNTLLPIEINCTNGVVDAKTICMCYEFREDSQRFVDFIDKYTRVMLDSLKCNAMDILNRKGFPMVDSTYRDEDAEVTYTKEAINTLIDDYIIRRHSMTNLLWYLDILCKKERDELYQ